jgi:phosphatidylglycerol---prolipoprotein diacylglyceryl transferase
MDFVPNQILLNLGFFQIRWYGVILALAVASGFLVFFKLILKKEKDISKDSVANLLFYTVIFSLIGGRIVYVLSFIPYFIKHPLEIIYIWQGGISFYGVLIAGLLTFFFFSKKIFKEKESKQSFFVLLDIGVISLALAQVIGRWGNYFNQELFGKPCEYFFCIPIEYIYRPLEFLNFTHFHPVFLYESILMLILFFTLLYMFRNKYVVGYISSIYLVFHSIIRFLLEFLRLDIQPEFLGLRLFQYLAIVELIIGIVLLILVKNGKIKEEN